MVQRNRRTRREYLLVVVVLMTAGIAAAAGYQTDFQGFTSGTINNQDGWTVEDQWGNTSWGDDPAQYDQEITDAGGGDTVWRVSNAVTSGGLSGQPFSPVADEVAGETGSALWNDRGPDHTNPLDPPNPNAYATTKYFYGSFDFRSVTGAAQADLAMSVSASAKQFDGRMSYVELVDDGTNGIDVYFYETGHTTDVWGDSSDYVEIASDLSYTATHSIEIYLEFVDGLQDIGGDLYGNDIVKVLVDGTLAHTGTSWETYYKGSDPYGTGGDHAVDSLTFPLRGTFSPGNVGGGFYFENVEVSNVPEPASMSLLVLGGAMLLRRRRG